MVKAIVGANWGDEGKGKITDMLGETSDIIVRFQGGANAGHTIINDYGKFALHTLPSGVFYDHTTSIIGNGVALNIPVLFKEIGKSSPRVCQSRISSFPTVPRSLCRTISCLMNTRKNDWGKGLSDLQSRGSHRFIQTNMQRSASRSTSCSTEKR